MLNCKFSKALTTRNRTNRHRRQRKNAWNSIWPPARLIFHAFLHVKVDASPSSFLVFTTTVYHSFSAWRGEDLRFAAVHFKGMEPMQRLQDPSGSSTPRLLCTAATTQAWAVLTVRKNSQQIDFSDSRDSRGALSTALKSPTTWWLNVAYVAMAQPTWVALKLKQDLEPDQGGHICNGSGESKEPS